jgi:hypothetical protein
MDTFSKLVRMVVLLAAAALTGCATQKLSPAPSEGLDADAAVVFAVDDLIRQADDGRGFLGRLAAKRSRSKLVLDPLLDAGSGQQTELMKALEQKIGERVATDYPTWELLPFRATNVAEAQYLLAGTLTYEDADAQRKLRLNASLTELATGVVVAQTSVLIRDEGLDVSPTRYFRDSPISVRDRSTEAYAATARMPAGRKADPDYLRAVATAALISEATSAYNSARYDEALKLYASAAESLEGEQLRVLNGLYLTNWKLGRASEAERAFRRIVSYGLSNNALAVKVLFRPGSTDFWPDPNVSGPYAIWMRQIAREASASRVCLNLVGHTSRTGSEQVNARLSQQRALVIKQRLETEAPELSARMRYSGVGWRENLVGTGTDDVRDALDRRVEFHVVDCESAAS